jgi:GNAT superfamily N-acetyltransferase
MTIDFSRYDPTFSYTGQKKFDCEHEDINKFVHDSLKSQIRKGLSIGYVLTDSAQNKRFVGFFTIAQHSIGLPLLQSLALGSLPKQIPCTRLIMLGVDKDYKGHNLGKQLMKEAFIATKRAAQSVGSFGIYLDADTKAVSFYQKLGFKLLQGDLSPAPSPMFLPKDGIP